MKLNIRFVIRYVINGNYVNTVGLMTGYFEKAISFSKKYDAIKFIIDYKLQDVQIIKVYDYSNSVYSDET